MKNSTYLIILMAVALVCVIWHRTSNTSAPDSAANTAKATITDIMTRSSVRSYSDRPVASETVDTLLRAAMAAPTAANRQPWRFVVIDNKETLWLIGDHFSSMTMAKEAQVAVVACGDMAATLDGTASQFWVQDVSAATENLLLAAHALGLGAVWCGIYPRQDRVDDFTTLLQLPDSIVPMACVCIGYPAGETTPKDKWHPEYIRYNTWE